ncbi:MAG: RluA family pseudouridine synthase [Pseudomonadota bacterium]
MQAQIPDHERTLTAVDSPEFQEADQGRRTYELPPFLVPHSKEPIAIVYGDAHLLLVRKPDLLLSVPGRHPLNKDCMISRLQLQYPDALTVHRLDLDTSGVMVVARGRDALVKLNRLFQQQAVRKTYRAWVHGLVKHDEGSIDLPIARDWPNRPRQKISSDGKPSLTRFKVLRRIPAQGAAVGDSGTKSETVVAKGAAAYKGPASYLELYPQTGRSHQLRIHLAHIGHPILGCDLYASNQVLGSAPRLMLHATCLEFTHPYSGKQLVGHSRAPF